MSDQRVQRVESFIACGKSGLLFCQSHAVLTPIPRMSETCLTEMKRSLEIIYYLLLKRLKPKPPMCVFAMGVQMRQWAATMCEIYHGRSC